LPGLRLAGGHREAISAIDSTADKGIIYANKAIRHKTSLKKKLLNSLSVD